MKTISNKLSLFIFWAALILIGVLLLVGFTGEATRKFPLFLALGFFAALVVFIVLQIINRAKQGEALRIIWRYLRWVLAFFIVLFCLSLAFNKDVLQKVGGVCARSAFEAIFFALITVWDSIMNFNPKD